MFVINPPPTWESAALSLLPSVVVGLLALGGVLWSTMYNARKSREAENLRHENSLDFHRESRRHDLRLEAYVELLAAAHMTATAAHQLTGFDCAEPFEVWRPRYEARLGEFMTTMDDLHTSVARCEIVGSRQVAEKALLFKTHCIKMQAHVIMAYLQTSHDQYVSAGIVCKMLKKTRETITGLVRQETGFAA